MTSERFRFLNNLKAEATTKGKVDVLDPAISTTRPDVSPVPFSENFTEDDLSRMGEMISDNDEEPFLAPRISPLHSTNTNGDSPASSELHVPASHILQSSLQACGGGSSNDTGFAPDQWFALIRWAKQDGNPYIVKEMGTSDFFDFKTLLSGCNWKMNTDRERVFWSQIRQLEILPDESNKIDYKTNFCDHEFKTIIVQNTLETPRTRRIRNIRENNLLLAPLSRPLIQAYMGKLPIPQAKLQDLKYLCQTNIIPSIYHEFYNNLIEGCVRDVDERSEEDEEE